MVKQHENALQTEETTRQHAGARYESNIAKMAQSVATRKGSLQRKARKSMETGNSHSSNIF